MHENEFEIVSKESHESGKIMAVVRIRAADLDRKYLIDPQSREIQLQDDPIVIAGHDMTSIIGKRIREWLGTDMTQI